MSICLRIGAIYILYKHEDYAVIMLFMLGTLRAHVCSFNRRRQECRIEKCLHVWIV